MVRDLIMKKETIEDLAILGGLIALQFVYAGNSVCLSYLMSLGFTPYTIVIFTTSATFLVTSPAAIYFERRKWPKTFSFKLMMQILFISFAGVTLFQSLFLKGIKLTSPALATAMPNLAPGLIFLIAWAARLEKVRLSCMYSKIKIVGTFLCVLGALTMSLMHSSKPTKNPELLAPPFDANFDMQKMTGCLYLLAAVLVMAANVVLQASTLGDFPAPMSLCTITSFIGVIMTSMVHWFQGSGSGLTWPPLLLGELIGYSLVAGAIGGTGISFSGWAMKKKGPVLVSMFNPIGTVISVLLSIITLGETIRLGSLAGMLLMFTGLYFVLWAKGKEAYNEAVGIESL
ncbi:WAT1-related protein At5g47470 isoform X2 [Mercurialis annua]|uniref:WAT1-related protein At5g47470 isoform X2 n=1 Tax=Mercurialis annua TaxID=3986 RepID=UPI002160647C|nr:WAT1-related protein At5g47470 isoform X2 [Mercurialis annua]